MEMLAHLMSKFAVYILALGNFPIHSTLFYTYILLANRKQ